VPAREVRRIAYADAGAASRAWLETRDGEEYALVEGRLPRVREVAEEWAHAMRLSTSEAPPGDQLNEPRRSRDSTSAAGGGSPHC
jgi:hypothetical protein